MAFQNMTNVTFSEIKIGASASLSISITQSTLEVLSLLSGDVDPFVLQDDDFSEPRPDANHAESAGATALIAGVLGVKLPGPGMRIVRQDLLFRGTVQVGDRLTATVKAREKFAESSQVAFDCHCADQHGNELVHGTVWVVAPTETVSYNEFAPPELTLRRGDGLSQLLRASVSLDAVRCAIVHPCDRDSLLGPVTAARRGMLLPVLVGPEARIRAVAEEAGINLDDIPIVPAPHSHAAAAKAVELARGGEVEAIMKGSLHTDELLSAIVSSTTGLRTARRISHVFVMDVPTYPRILLITDAAINIYPKLEQKVDIVQNAIDLAHIVGIDHPKVAILSAVETVNPEIQSTIEAAALCKMADRRQITGGVLDGPLAFDNAISVDAARTKGIESAVAGRADILLVPDLESGNMLAKQLSYLAGAEGAGIVMGTRVPIVLTSRADSIRTRLASIALMVLVADARRKSKVELK